MKTLNRGSLLVVSLIIVVAAVGLSACAGTTGQENQSSSQEQPSTSSSTDWETVGQTVGKEGKLMKGDVYRIDLPRSDLKVTSQGVDNKPALSLGSYTAFKDMGNGNAMVMGDLVLTEDEYNKVISKLQDGGIGQTAVHKHLLDESPAMVDTHSGDRRSGYYGQHD